MFSNRRLHLVITFALTTASAVTLRAEEAADATLLRMDFSGEPQGQEVWGLWDGWGGKLVAENERLHVTSTQSNPNRYLLNLNFSGDISISARFIGANALHWCGLGFGFVQGVRLTVDNQDKVNLSTPEGNLGSKQGWRSIAKDPTNFVLRLDIVGKRMSAFIDDQMVIEATAGQRPKAGAIGVVGGWNTDLWIDDLTVTSLAEGPRPILAEPVNLLDGRTRKPDSIYHDGDTVPVTIWLHNGLDEQRKILVRLRLLDFWLRPVDTRVREVTMSPAGLVRLDEQYRLDRRGVFKVAVDAGPSPRKLAWVADALSFSVIPADIAKRTAKKDSMFGLHCEQQGVHQTVHVAKTIGAQWARAHDTMWHTYWLTVEREEGEFNWWGDNTNQKVLDEAGVQLIGLFAFTPWWTARIPEGMPRKNTGPWDRNTYGFYPPQDLTKLERYVTKIVEHYPQIEVWEIWNEPFGGGFWRGSIDQYVQVSKVCYEAAKKTRPDCTVLGGGGLFLNTMPTIEKLFQAGLGKYMDALAIHTYVNPEYAEEKFPVLRDLMRKYDCDVPIWNTEWGGGGASFLDQYARDPFKWDDAGRLMSYEIVRHPVTHLAAGCVRTVYYGNWSGQPYLRGSSSQFNIVEGTGSLKPIGVAYATTIFMLDGSKFKEKVTPLPWMPCYLFARGDEAVAVYWGAGAVRTHGMRTQVAVDLPDGIDPDRVMVVDIMNNERPIERDTTGRFVLTVSAEPVFLRARSGVDSVGILRKICESAEPIVPGAVPLEVSLVDEEVDAEQVAPEEPFDGAAEVEDENWLKVELRAHCNMGFADEVPGDGKGGWTDQGPFNDMRDIPLGQQRWLDVPFDVIDPAKNSGRGCIALRSSLYAPAMPLSRKGIPIGKKLKRMFLLHTAGWGPDHPDVLYCKYVINYAGGHTVEIPVHGRHDSGDWWLAPHAESTARAVPIKVSNVLVEGFSTRYLRIMEWKNPLPANIIESFDVVSANGKPEPILIAVTGER